MSGTGDPRHMIVIGGGVGGYTAAIRGARHGMKVTLVEDNALGGTCLNVGCIPTKSLLHNSRMIRELPHHLELVGSEAFVELKQDVFGNLGVEKSAAVDRLVQGVETLIKRNRITHVQDRAVLSSANAVRLEKAGREISGDIVVLATGSVPAIPKVKGIDCEGVVTSDAAIDLKECPKQLAIMGGGVIGVEFAQIFANLGTEVTIIEIADTILTEEDPEAAAVLAKVLEGEGVSMRTGTRVDEIKAVKSRLQLNLKGAAGDDRIEADMILVATGRKPNIDGVGLEAASVDTRHGAIVVDERMRTSAPGVYAVGDATGGPLLAHRATAQAECALADILGTPAPAMSALAMPRAVYTHPEIASVGLSEAEARSRGPVKVGRSPFSANGKALVDGHAEGFVKIVADAEYEQILGITMVGPDVSNLLGEATLAVQMELTLSALMFTVHAHPTLSEALAEAAHDAHDGGAIHMPPARKR
ncbi:MAG: dihydrolipoyl dehydrogenase [Rhizobiaceae bacterium]|nr:dihydrolipoyl dehydrogenase [Rhizobiaceae bacterium]